MLNLTAIVSKVDRTSERSCGADWEQERIMAENVQIAMEIEKDARVVGSVRL